jgi:7-cyano-7-deazaguanine synthase
MLPKLDLSRALQRKTVIACVSGGLDSCVMLVRLAETFAAVHPIFIRNGHHWEETECQALKRFIATVSCPQIYPLKELSIPVRKFLDEHWGVEGYNPKYDDGYDANFIPGRNVVLLSAIAVPAYVERIPNIALGILQGNPYPDAQLSFFQAFETMIEQGFHFPLRVLTPLGHLEKEEVILMGAGLPLELSFSCVNPHNGRHCGAYCNKCAERQKGFALAGVTDPTDYATQPPAMDWHNHHF